MRWHALEWQEGWLPWLGGSLGSPCHPLGLKQRHQESSLCEARTLWQKPVSRFADRQVLDPCHPLCAPLSLHQQTNPRALLERCLLRFKLERHFWVHQSPATRRLLRQYQPLQLLRQVKEVV